MTTKLEFLVPPGARLADLADELPTPLPRDGATHVIITVYVERPKAVARRQALPRTGRGLVRAGDAVIKQLVECGVLATEGRASTVWLNRRFADSAHKPGTHIVVMPL